MELRNLVAQNPWWSEVESIKSDYYIQQFEASPIIRQPRVQNEFDLTKDSVYILQGPRQVGKTTLLKRMIQELLVSKKLIPGVSFALPVIWEEFGTISP
jgi:predicted AAA+ superfamily ATPase